MKTILVTFAQKISCTKGSTTTITTTQLPGVDSARVIPSSPTLIKENSHTPSIKKK